MDLVTWNLNGLDDLAEGPRVEAALQEILLGVRLEALMAGRQPETPPEVILLQEVTARSFHAHLKHHLRAAGFELFPPSPPDRSYFELLAARPPLEVRAHRMEPLWKSQYGRWLHELELTGPQGELTVLTAHFDSGPEPATAAARRAQLRDVVSRLVRRAVFAGDTNLREAEWRAEEARLSVIDAHLALGSPKDLARTWRSARAGARFDRVWLSPDLRPEGLSGLGLHPLPGLGRPPSDHIGLRLRFSIGD